MPPKSSFAIGIDLGTSNCALAYVDPADRGSRPKILALPQWETPQRIVEKNLLPSFAVFRHGEEDPTASACLSNSYMVGIIASNEASRTPEKVIRSAKSWLVHRGVDRKSKILPWKSEALSEEEKLSPVEASALYLSFLRKTWDERMAAGDESRRFDRQEIVVTVPASFDQDAQRLTLRAAQLAGYPKSVRLLEEPQAAFYAWMDRFENSGALRSALGASGRGPHHLLVVDVGGGTTDLSLFSINFTDSVPAINRVAVSDHILLGGDNIDLALAHRLGGGQMPKAQWHALVNLCRDLKEKVLSGHEPADREYSLGIVASGSKLFRGAETIRARHGDVVDLVVNGFFGPCVAGERPQRQEQGLREAGLPYAHDPQIIRHIDDFLAGRPPVDSILCNGGTLVPGLLKKRIAGQISLWQGGSKKVASSRKGLKATEKGVHILEKTDDFLAVACGAALFGRDLLLRRNRLIIAGSSHGFYIEFSPEDLKKDRYLTCVLPQSTPLESAQQITKLNLSLRVNQPVEFRAFSTVRRHSDHTGQIVKLNDSDFRALPPMLTIARLEGAKRKVRSDTIPVTIESRINALGLLRIFLLSAEKPVQGRWELEFDLRRTEKSASAVREKTRESNTLSENARTETARLLKSGFGASLLRNLEKITGLSRGSWNRAVLREFFRPLADNIQRRNSSPEYESAWLNGAGYFLRPGYGAPLDEFRTDQLWQVHERGLCHPRERVVRDSACVMWRRVAGGLDQERQKQLYNDYIFMAGQHSRQAQEPIRLLGVLERIPPEYKKELFEVLMEGAARLSGADRLTPYLWALGRILSRTPLYGGEKSIMSPSFVEKCFDILKDRDWSEPGMEALPALFSMACRRTDCLHCDVSGAFGLAVAEKLKNSGAREDYIRVVERFVPLTRTDMDVIFGESLPSGLVIVDF
ncbi:Hsp70 family protein [Candidatus Riflebacteria bacterium]